MELTPLQAKRMRLKYTAQGLGRRVGTGSNPAIVVIDMSMSFCSDDYLVGHKDDNVVEAIYTILETGRQARIPVVFTTTSFDDPRQAGYWGVKIPGLLELVSTDSNATSVHPRLSPSPEEMIFNKHYSSAFFGTDLDSWFKVSRIDTLIVTGCSTSGCVRASIVDAVSLGYRVIVPQPAVGDRAEGPHEWALFDIDSKYGDVVSMRDTIAYIQNIVTGRREN